MQAGQATKYISNINLLQAYTASELIIRGFWVSNHIWIILCLLPQTKRNESWKPAIPR